MPGYDRNTGLPFASRSEVIASNGMAATSHPLATQIALDILKAGGNAIDAAIAANAALGLMEPTGNGVGGDLFAIVWDASKEQLVGLNASGRAPALMTLRGVQVGRTPIFRLKGELAALETPVLLMAGDEDESCLDVNLWLKRVMPTARLVVFPASGHVLNLEEPTLFNRFAGNFIKSVDKGDWRPRPHDAMPGSVGATAVGLGDD